MKRSSRMPSFLIAVAVAGAIGVAAVLTGPLAASTPAPPTKDRLVKERVLILQGYIERYAAAHELVYPAKTVVRYGGGLHAPLWPLNPFTGTRMAPGTARGTYTYTVAPDGSSYTLTGHLSSGSYKVSGAAPGWLAADRSEWEQTALALKDETVKRNVDLLRAFADEWALLHNGAAPAAADLTAAGAVGQTHSDWPVDPYSDQPMATGSSAGEFGYGVNQDGTYWLTGHLGKQGATDYSVTAAPPFINLRPMRDELTLRGAALIRDAVEYSAVDHNDLFPVPAEVSQSGEVGGAYWPTDLSWPGNAWTNVFMAGGGGLGDFTYALTGIGEGFTLTAHLSSGDVTLGQSDWSKHFSLMREHFKDLCAQRGVQVLKDYVDEWKLAHGALPLVEEMTSADAVGGAHAYWPGNPWTGVAMEPGSDRGDYEYAPAGDGQSFTILVHESLDPAHPGLYPEPYVAQ
jgi:hypothetical protein